MNNNKKSTEVTTNNISAMDKNHKYDSLNRFIIWYLTQLINGGVPYYERFR